MTSVAGEIGDAKQDELWGDLSPIMLGAVQIPTAWFLKAIISRLPPSGVLGREVCERTGVVLLPEPEERGLM